MATKQKGTGRTVKLTQKKDFENESLQQKKIKVINSSIHAS